MLDEVCFGGLISGFKSCQGGGSMAEVSCLTRHAHVYIHFVPCRSFLNWQNEPVESLTFISFLTENFILYVFLLFQRKVQEWMFDLGNPATQVFAHSSSFTHCSCKIGDIMRYIGHCFLEQKS